MKKSLPTFALACLCAMGAAAQAVTADSAKVKPEYQNHGLFYQQRASLFDVLPVDSTNIVMLGNSLTNGCEWHELFDNPKVVNRGISGDIVGGLEDRLQSVVSGNPAKIFLMIGVNDISHDLTPDSIATAITALVQHIRRETPATRLYVQSLLPFNNDFGQYRRLTGHDTDVAAINAIISRSVTEAGATYIDLYPLFVNTEGKLRPELTNDGLHMLGPAYLLWRDALLPYLNQ